MNDFASPAILAPDPKEDVTAAVEERIRRLEEELEHWRALLRTLSGNLSADDEAEGKQST